METALHGQPASFQGALRNSSPSQPVSKVWKLRKKNSLRSANMNDPVAVQPWAYLGARLSPRKATRQGGIGDGGAPRVPPLQHHEMFRSVRLLTVHMEHVQIPHAAPHAEAANLSHSSLASLRPASPSLSRVRVLLII